MERKLVSTIVRMLLAEHRFVLARNKINNESVPVKLKYHFMLL